MFTGVENWARTPPMLLPVEPLPCELSRSMTSTLLQPACVRCQAMLEPTMPPPMMTTSAVCMLFASQCLPLLEQSLGLGQCLLRCLCFLSCGRGVSAVHGDDELAQIANHLGKRRLPGAAFRCRFAAGAARSSKLLFVLGADFSSLRGSMDRFNSLVGLLQGLDQFQLKRKLPFQIRRGNFHTRIHDQMKWLYISRSTDGEPDLVRAGKGLRTFRLAGHIAASNCGHAVTGLSNRWGGITNVPDETVHPGGRRERFSRFEPVCRKRRLRGRMERLIFARVGAHDLALRIQHFKFYFTLRLRLQVIVEDRSGWWVLTRRLFRRQWRVMVGAGAYAHGGGGLEEMGRSCLHFGGELPKWRYIVENPERPAVSCCHQIVVLDHQ